MISSASIGVFSLSEEFNSKKYRIDAREFFAQLNKLGIEYVLVGGLALLNYVDGRNTNDVDVIVAMEDIEKLEDFHQDDIDGDFARGKFRSLIVDVLLPRNPLFKMVLQDYAVEGKLDDIPIKIAAPLGLLILKLYALPSLYRQGNFENVALYEADITQLLLRKDVNADEALVLLKNHLSSVDIDELKKIIAEINNRRKRFTTS